MKTVKKVGSTLISVILWIIILLAALYSFTTMATRDNTNVSNLAGFTPMVVKTDSMAPTFSAGDLIIIQKCDPEKLVEGDIITFHTIIENEYALNTHRIEAIEVQNGSRAYTTKGDNNAIADTHIISDGDIVGKYVTALPKVGHVMDFLSSSLGFLVVIVLPMLLFFIYQVYHLIMVSVRLKQAMAQEAQEEKAAAYLENEAALTAKAEAEAALEEAKRLKAEAEAALAKVQKQQNNEEKTAKEEAPAETEDTEKSEATEGAEIAEKAEAVEKTETIEEAENAGETAEETEVNTGKEEENE